VGGVLVASTSRRTAARTAALALAGSVITLLLMSPLSPIAPANLSLGHVVHDGPYARLPAAIGQAVGPDEVVSTNVFPLFSHRQDVYEFPLPFAPGEVAGGPPSVTRAARVDVVVVREYRRAEAASYGFSRVVYDDGRLIVARRP
jgi:hypothetical protein